MNPLLVNSTMLLPLQILLVEEKADNPVNTSIFSVLQSASRISKYKKVSLTLGLLNGGIRKNAQLMMGPLYFDGKVGKENVVLSLIIKLHPY